MSRDDFYERTGRIIKFLVVRKPKVGLPILDEKFVQKM